MVTRIRLVSFVLVCAFLTALTMSEYQPKCAWAEPEKAETDENVNPKTSGFTLMRLMENHDKVHGIVAATAIPARPSTREQEADPTSKLKPLRTAPQESVERYTNQMGYVENGSAGQYSKDMGYDDAMMDKMLNAYGTEFDGIKETDGIAPLDPGAKYVMPPSAEITDPSATYVPPAAAADASAAYTPPTGAEITDPNAVYNGT